MLSAILSVYREHGIKGFWYGYGATFARDAPYAGLYVLYGFFLFIRIGARYHLLTAYSFYEYSKIIVPELLSFTPVSGQQPLLSSSTSAMVNSICAASSAGLATAITNPFDAIKTRVQLRPAEYRGLVPAGLRVVREEGIRGLFDGLGMRMIRKSFSAGIAWCIYEQLVRT